MIPRYHPQYVDIENFEEHELTICIAYEMAIRSPKVIEIINRNLDKNIQWYEIDLICRSNQLLKQYNVAPATSISKINNFRLKSTRKEIQDALEYLFRGQDSEIYHVISSSINKPRNYTYLKLSQDFYSYVETLRIEIETDTFEDTFRELENIGAETDITNLIDSAQAIEEFYNNLSEDEQRVIKILIALNIGKGEVDWKYDILYKILEEDACVLRDDCYLDTFNDDGTASMSNIHLLYPFIEIYDHRFCYDRTEEEFIYRPRYNYVSAINLNDKIPTLTRKRPLLKSDRAEDTIVNIVFTVPEKEFEAQIREVRKQYLERHKVVKNFNLSSLFELNEEYVEIVPLKNKARLADMFFLYDNMNIHTQDTDEIRKEYSKNIAELRAYKKIQGHLGRDSLDDDPGSMSYDVKEKILKEEMQSEITKLKKDFDYNFKNELMKYHDKVQIEGPSEKTIISYSEYELQQDNIDETSVFFPDMKSSSFTAKYNTMKKFIKDGEYKKLF